MSDYTDYQRQKIAQREYAEFKFGDEVNIELQNGEELTIGYVSEVERS
ncbi:hypothetical protein [Streptococcus plurextorum]|nr:hypothetical protein [Streptococcus plurextorum]